MGRKKLLGVVALLSALLAVPLVFSSGLVNVSRLLSPSNAGTSSSSTSSSTEIFVDPASVIDVALQNRSTFTVHVNVSGVADLFSWQINMTWDSNILNVTEISAGDFLLQTPSVDKTSSYQLGFVINATDNVKGHAGMSESILGDVSGVSGDGRLISIEFGVVGYGSTDLTIDLTGSLQTTLLNSTYDEHHETISFTKTDGYFRNKLPGDIDGDKDVDYDDFVAFGLAYLKTIGHPSYNREADMELDGDVDYDDFVTFGLNYLHTIEP